MTKIKKKLIFGQSLQYINSDKTSATTLDQHRGKTSAQELKDGNQFKLYYYLKKTRPILSFQISETNKIQKKCID
jgi:hypothetical protein